MSELEPNSTLIGDHRRYHVTGILGQGGFGTVYRARMEGAGGFRKDVALKILRDEDPPVDVLSRFRDEARILGLVHNPHVVGVDPPVRLGGRWAVVMEFVDGTSCDELLAAGPLPPAIALEVCAVVAQTLFDLFHATDPAGNELRIVHRDLKPSNIQITPAGHVKLLDFGIARADFDERETSTVAHIGGTPGYIAPERLDGHEGHEGDVYSLGVVLHRMVTGHRPTAAGEGSDGVDDRATPQVRELLRDPAVKAVVDYARALRDPDFRARPAGDRVAADLRGLRARIGGPTLREWCRALVPSAPQRAPDAMVGRTLSETLARPRAREGLSAPWLAMGVGSAVAGAGAVVLVIGALALGVGLFLASRPGAPPPAPAPPSAPAPVVGAEPVPAPEPAPEATPAPPPPSARPAPRRPPAPAAPAPQTGRVEVTGDATAVTLRCGGASYTPGSSVPAGACTIVATFGTAPATPAGTITVPAGGVVTLSCSSSFQRCRAK